MNEQGNVEYIMKHPDKNNFIDNQNKVKYLPSKRTGTPTPNLIERNKIIQNSTIRKEKIEAKITNSFLLLLYQIITNLPLNRTH